MAHDPHDYGLPPGSVVTAAVIRDYNAGFAAGDAAAVAGRITRPDGLKPLAWQAGWRHAGSQR